MHNPEETFKRLRSASEASPWPDIGTRRRWLSELRDAVVENRAAIQEAVWSDFRKSSVEADLTEVVPVLLELRTALRELKSWTAPKRIKGTFPIWGVSSKIHFRPKGVVLIISPWNYPFTLSLGPLTSAIAAGNRAFVKPSERTPASSRLIRELVHSVLPDDVAVVIEGGAETGSRLLDLPFDHVFFTGGHRIAKKVMQAAVDHMSTVTLELGGKSPAIVDGTVAMAQCAEKIVRGKFLNAGQTCIAPDYVVVGDEHFDRFVDAARKEASRLDRVADMSAPVDREHETHWTSLLEDAAAHGAVLHRTGTSNTGLTIVTGVPLTCLLMKEEIFGPILPVLRYRSQEELFGILHQNPTPLTTYVFSNDDALISGVSHRLQTGALCINETLLHFVHPGLPFGGVGSSGSGRAHGRAGFETFSNLVPAMRQNFRKGTVPLLYPPVGKTQEWVRSIMLRVLGGRHI